MEKQTKISYWLLAGGIIGSIVHNLIFGAIGVEEPVFFLISVFGFLGFFVSILVNIVTYKLKGKPKDLWKLGWMGLVGLLGFIPQFGPRFYGLYASFAFFGLKKK